ADQAASRGFAAPPPPDKSDTSPAVGSSMDALQTRSWMLGAFDAQADSPGSQPAFPEVAGFIDASMSPDIASGSPRIGTPEAFPSLESFQFDVSALENADAPLDPASPPDLSDLFFRYDTTDPPNITQLADKPADEPPGQEIQWSSSGAFSANATPAGDDRAPITYLPFGQPAPESNAVNLPADKLQVEVASSFADVNKDATLALLAFKTALLKVIDTAGEQDRIDALHREASRRACL
ncbi:MAG TPA: hypothetical protein VGZ26_04315, partial [Pirellulales bacterium]|nr:hypothetical protein [Pirellulales bacterium]